MKVFITTYGSRGDVQPYVALGKRLLDSGHDVTLATSSRFQDFVCDHGLKYGYMNDRLLAIVDTDQGRELLENTNGVFAVVRRTLSMLKQVGPLQESLLEECWNAARQCRPDCILFHPKAYGGPHYAEKLDVPVVLALPFPMFVPTGECPMIGFPNLRLGAWYNRMTYRAVNRLMALSAGKHVRRWRAQHGLRKQRRFDMLHATDGREIPVLHAYSRLVLPQPSDWPESATTTGYWFMDESKHGPPPSEIESFLSAGDAPVYVGFGSMAGRYPERLTEIVVKAIQKANVRGILVTGWGGLVRRELPDSILCVSAVPHDWLFPQISAVVHHGGAGTTAAGLRAGRPTVVCPFFGDQPFWGDRVYQLGVGPKPIPQKQLTVEKLASAIKQTTSNSDIKTKAETLGSKLRQEDGIGTTIALIEDLVRTHHAAARRPAS